ncbi:MAG: sulfite exporter TauE/SafE family protein [Candidatus Omnitrophica bacterium]|nr:sulfite exporter TauE/SafE family protein [Candidatus Omnitrophota bacterium]
MVANELTKNLMAGVAVLFIGLSKAGFGGGLGMLTTPLCVMAFDARIAIGVLLPLLCAGDIFSLRYYWRKWDRRNLAYLLPGVVVGVVIGVHLIGGLSPRQLNQAIGFLAVAFVLFQVIRERVFRAEGTFSPNHKVGIPCGIGAGITSSMAHGAGPVISVFLIPQQLPKEIYVGTTVLVFTWINWIKLPFFVANGVITWHTVAVSLVFLPLVPVGVWLGIWLNRKVSEALFTRLIYVITFLSGLELMFHFEVSAWLR